jgi:peptidoglycan/LPS O-acetylase OafA/YrhL
VRIKYRPEIDGLRAVSVFAVILYHSNFILFNHPLFQGGFIGVDIFFVISGYLITTLILKEIVRTNQFSFKCFYERRIRRILPVLLYVIIISSIVSYFILLPSSLIDFGKSIVATIFFFSNIYFWIVGNKYGEETELLRPMLHTWSLSVEEQFYILFPIFLIIIFKFFKKYLAKILIFIFLFSLIFAQYASTTEIVINHIFFRWELIFFEKFNFYFFLSRIFELVIGSLLSYLELNNKNKHKSYSILNKLCPALGVILIFYSFFFFNFTKIFHPSVISLIPLIGVSLIIVFSKKGELITKILSNKILVFFGLISYSLYLWHYPIFAFLRYVDVFNNSIQIKLLAILLTVIFSIFSYYFIERPFRNKNIISLNTLITCLLISAIIILSYSFYILKTAGIKDRFPNIFSEKLSENIKESELNRVPKNINNVLLIGDSHSHVLKYYLNNELTKQSYNFYNESTDLYLKNFNQINKKNDRIEKIYIENNNKIDKFLQEHKNLIIIWHQRWSIRLLEEFFDNKEGYTEYQSEQYRYTASHLQPLNTKITTLEQRKKYLTEGINSSIKNILEKGHTLILVYPVPEMGFNPLALLTRKHIYSKIINKKLEVPILSGSYDVYMERNKIIFNTLDKFQNSNIYRVYPHKHFCNTLIKNRCVANNKMHLFYADDDHLSLEGSKYIVNDIIKIIQKIEIDKKISK